MYNANGTQFRTYDFNCEAPYNSDGLFGFQQPDFFLSIKNWIIMEWLFSSKTNWSHRCHV